MIFQVQVDVLSGGRGARLDFQARVRARLGLDADDAYGLTIQYKLDRSALASTIEAMHEEMLAWMNDGGRVAQIKAFTDAYTAKLLELEFGLKRTARWSEHGIFGVIDGEEELPADVVALKALTPIHENAGRLTNAMLSSNQERGVLIAIDGFECQRYDVKFLSGCLSIQKVKDKPKIKSVTAVDFIEIELKRPFDGRNAAGQTTALANEPPAKDLDQKITPVPGYLAMGIDAVDSVTGFKGVITGRMHYFDGAVRYRMEPHYNAFTSTAEWFEASRVQPAASPKQ